jgi:hypothetical protein
MSENCKNSYNIGIIILLIVCIVVLSLFGYYNSCNISCSVDKLTIYSSTESTEPNESTEPTEPNESTEPNKLTEPDNLTKPNEPNEVDDQKKKIRYSSIQAPVLQPIKIIPKPTPKPKPRPSIINFFK